MRRWSGALLPLSILLVLLALTAWLRYATEFPEERSDGKNRHDPDYIVTQVSGRKLDATGKLLYTLVAEEIRHYPDDDTADLLEPALVYLSPTRPPLSMRAVHGHANSGGQQVDLWVFDPTVPPPEGALIYYSVYAPAITGELAKQLQAEMRRRRSAMRGSARPRHAHWFTGLLICGHCGHRLTYGENGSDEPIWRCPTKWAPYIQGSCVGQNVREDYLQPWMDTRLRLMIERQTADVFEDLGLVPSVEQTTATLESRLAEVQARARRLIEKQAAADTALSGLYDEQLKQCAAEIKSLQERIREAARRTDDKAKREREEAVAEMSTDGFLDRLWTRPNPEVNQFLHRVMAKRRFILFSQEVVRVVEE